MEAADSPLLLPAPVLFTAVAAGPVSLTCCIRGCTPHLTTTLELLVVDAAQSRAWSTTFTVSAVNAALQDEELTGPELAQVLAAVLPCQAAVTAVLQPGGQLRLEAWCHRTQRVPLLPPTDPQRQAGSDYRQAAFCISLPVSPSLSEPQWMQEQRGQAFADTMAGFLAAVMQRDQLLQDTVLRLQSQLQLVCSHSAQLQVLADRAVKTAVKGTPGLKQDPALQQQQHHHHSRTPAQDGGASFGCAAAEAVAGGASFGASQQPADACLGTQGLGLLGSQVPGPGAGAGAAPVLPFNPMLTQRAGSGGRAGNGGSMPPPGAGSGGSSRPHGTATAGSRAHLARQSQDEKALRQMWAEQQALLQDWQQRLHPLVNCQASLDAYLQLVQRTGGVGQLHVTGQRVAAQPWHLGQQQEQPPEQQQVRQQFGLGRADSMQRAPAADGATAAAGAHGGAPAAASSREEAEQEAIALVAPAKQKQAAGQKRKAHDGKSLLLKRGRR